MDIVIILVSLFIIIFYILMVFVHDDDVSNPVKKDIIVIDTDEKYRQRVTNINDDFIESDRIFDSNPRFYFYIDNAIKKLAIQTFVRSFFITFLTNSIIDRDFIPNITKSFISASLATSVIMAMEYY